MPKCPYCRAALASPAAVCPHCRADVSPLTAAAAPVLVVSGPAGRTARFALPDGTHRLGCADPAAGHRPDLDLSGVDADRVVSRRHVLVRVRGGRVYFAEEPLTGDAAADAGRYAAGQRGRAGTRVDGARVGPAEVELRPGSEARLGSVSARLDAA